MKLIITNVNNTNKIENNYNLRLPVNADLNYAPKELLEKLDKLPLTREDAIKELKSSKFINKYIPKEILDSYIK